MVTIGNLWTGIAAGRPALGPAQQARVSTVPEAGDDADPLRRQQQRAEDALAEIRKIAASSSSDRKATAQQRLEEAKEKLRELMRWVSDPEVLARLAKQLAQEIGSAARQFASGLSAGTSAGAMVSATEAGAPLPPPASSHTQATASGDGAAAEPAKKPTVAQRAYQEISASAGESRSDRETMEEFKALARQVKALLEKAKRELALEKAGSRADGIDKAIGELNAAMEGLASSMGPGAGTAAPSIPLSITI